MKDANNDGPSPGPYIRLADAAKLMRRSGRKRPSPEMLRRWANPNRGYDVGYGVKVYLRSIQRDGEVLTTVEWVETFERERNGVNPRPGRTG